MPSPPGGTESGEKRSETDDSRLVTDDATGQSRSAAVHRAFGRGRDRVVDPVRADLAADPYLRYVLALAVLTCGFGIWFRLPNFAVPDEYSRLIQPMKVAGRFVADPSFESIRVGITDGRALGATFYLYAAVLAPVFLVVLATGQIGEFARLGTIESRWALWHAAPAWFWTGTVLLGRLSNVALGVGCVYLTYRLGTELAGRSVGRLAALGLALSVGFFSQAHLVGEDVPMLFCLLATLLLANRYVERGDRAYFLLGSLAGGAAIAFKLSGGVGAIALGVAYLDRARRAGDTWEELRRPTVLVGGLAVGLGTVVVGLPSVLVGGPDELVARVAGSVGSKTTRSGGLSAPISYWIVRQYVAGMGLPLFLVAALGTGATLWHALDRGRTAPPLVALLATTVAVSLLVYGRWEFVRVRHLVPTYPVLLVLGADAVRRWGGLDRRGVRVGLALVLVATAAFAGAAEVQYVTDPRDGATQWLADNADPGETVEVYENSIADVGVPHGHDTAHYPFPEERATNTSSLVLNETAYTEWLYGLPERRPAYVQVTANELGYVDPLNPKSEAFPDRRVFFERLLGGEYDYAVAAEFGTRSRTETLPADFVETALRPEAGGVDRTVIVLERDDRA